MVRVINRWSSRGDGIANLSMTDRLTIANMAIEAGAKNGIFPVDDITKAYIKDRVTKPYEIVEADADAKYDSVVKINLAELLPVVALPHLPENVKNVKDIAEIKIDQVVIGSCTNGRIEDLQQAAEVMQGKAVHRDVRAIIIPGSQAVYLEAVKLGYIETFINAGAIVSTPTCGPCLGGYMGILAAGERAVATTNRNFRGRMGHVDSEVYFSRSLCSGSKCYFLWQNCSSGGGKIMILEGKVWRYGDNVDTDVIIPLVI